MSKISSKKAVAKAEVSLEETLERLVWGDLFSQYVRKFREMGHSYNDVIEVECLDMCDDIEILVSNRLKRIEKLVKDEKSEVNVYADALAKVQSGEISLEKFVGIKSKLKILQ